MKLVKAPFGHSRHSVHCSPPQLLAWRHKEFHLLRLFSGNSVPIFVTWFHLMNVCIKEWLIRKGYTSYVSLLRLHNKLPQRKGLKTTSIYSLILLELGRPKLRYGRPGFLLKALEKALFQASLLAAGGFLAYFSKTPIFTWISPSVHVCLCSNFSFV